MGWLPPNQGEGAVLAGPQLNGAAYIKTERGDSPVHLSLSHLSTLAQHHNALDHPLHAHHAHHARPEHFTPSHQKQTTQDKMQLKGPQVTTDTQSKHTQLANVLVSKLAGLHSGMPTHPGTTAAAAAETTASSDSGKPRRDAASASASSEGDTLHEPATASPKRGARHTPPTNQHGALVPAATGREKEIEAFFNSVVAATARQASAPSNAGKRRQMSTEASTEANTVWNAGKASKPEESESADDDESTLTIEPREEPNKTGKLPKRRRGETSDAVADATESTASDDSSTTKPGLLPRAKTLARKLTGSAPEKAASTALSADAAELVVVRPMGTLASKSLFHKHCQIQTWENLRLRFDYESKIVEPWNLTLRALGFSFAELTSMIFNDKFANGERLTKLLPHLTALCAQSTVKHKELAKLPLEDRYEAVALALLGQEFEPNMATWFSERYFTSMQQYQLQSHPTAQQTSTALREHVDTILKHGFSPQQITYIACRATPHNCNDDDIASTRLAGVAQFYPTTHQVGFTPNNITTLVANSDHGPQLLEALHSGICVDINPGKFSQEMVEAVTKFDGGSWALDALLGDLRQLKSNGFTPDQVSALIRLRNPCDATIAQAAKFYPPARTLGMSPAHVVHIAVGNGALDGAPCMVLRRMSDAVGILKTIRFDPDDLCRLMTGLDSEAALQVVSTCLSTIQFLNLSTHDMLVVLRADGVDGRGVIQELHERLKSLRNAGLSNEELLQDIAMAGGRSYNRSPFLNGAKDRDFRCVLHPSTLCARCWVQNTSRISNKRVSHFFYDRFFR